MSYASTPEACDGNMSRTSARGAPMVCLVCDSGVISVIESRSFGLCPMTSAITKEV